jgi:Mrp family chromosome partitioning ATPase
VALVLSWTDEALDQALVVARLAESFADRIEDPVLLIDLGPKRRLSHLLHAPAMGNLTEAMTGQVSWRDLIVQTGTAGLCVLPTGPGDFDADPVAVARLIESCKEDFGMVLVTGGTLANMPENILLASDAAVLLVEAGFTSSTATSGAIQRLRRCGADVLGCVMTGVSG